MEPVGGAASVFTLIEATGTIAKSAYALYRKYHKAPDKIQALAVQASRVQVQLQRIETTSRSHAAQIHNIDIDPSLDGGLKNGQAALHGLQQLLSRDGNIKSLRSRAMWMLKDDKRAEKCMMQLDQCHEQLVSFMTTSILGVTLQLSVGQMKVFQRIDAIEHLLATPSAAHTIGRPVHDSSRPKASSVARLHSGFKLRSKPWALSRLALIFGVSANCVSTYTQHDGSVQYSVTVRLPLSFLESFGSRMLQLHGIIVHIPDVPCPYQLKQLNYCLSKRVDSTDPFLAACRENNVELARKLSIQNPGCLNMVDDQGWNGLTYAIVYGRVDVIRDFINRKCTHSLDMPVDDLQTSLLQWAVLNGQLEITRLLLQNGASQDHFNKDGWDATFFLWSDLRLQAENVTECLDLLASYNDCTLDLDNMDTSEWTPVSRWAAGGNGRDLPALLKYKADLTKTTPRFSWSAVQFAVYYGNLSTFEALLSHYGGSLPPMLDDRGFTLVHIAVTGGRPDMVRRLHQLGLPMNCWSKPYSLDEPKTLRGKRCTPADLAIACHEPELAREILSAVPEWSDSLCLVPEHGIKGSNLFSSLLGLLYPPLSTIMASVWRGRWRCVSILVGLSILSWGLLFYELW